jgi:hypothetical protein
MSIRYIYYDTFLVLGSELGLLRRLILMYLMSWHLVMELHNLDWVSWKSNLNTAMESFFFNSYKMRSA